MKLEAIREVNSHLDSTQIHTRQTGEKGKFSLEKLKLTYLHGGSSYCFWVGQLLCLKQREKKDLEHKKKEGTCGGMANF